MICLIFKLGPMALFFLLLAFLAVLLIFTFVELYRSLRRLLTDDLSIIIENLGYTHAIELRLKGFSPDKIVALLRREQADKRADKLEDIFYRHYMRGVLRGLKNFDLF